MIRSDLAFIYIHLYSFITFFYIIVSYISFYLCFFVFFVFVCWHLFFHVFFSFSLFQFVFVFCLILVYQFLNYYSSDFLA